MPHDFNNVAKIVKEQRRNFIQVLSLSERFPEPLHFLLASRCRDYAQEVICIHLDDPAFNGYYHIWEIPDHRLRELQRFFMDYKLLENKEVDVQDFLGPDKARAVVKDAIAHYQEVVVPKLEAAGE